MLNITDTKSGDTFYQVNGMEIYECQVIDTTNHLIIDVVKKNMYDNTYKNCQITNNDTTEYFKSKEEAEQVYNHNVAKFILEISDVDALLKNLYNRAFHNIDSYEKSVDAVLYREVLEEMLHSKI
jgi:hypothetical protein